MSVRGQTASPPEGALTQAALEWDAFDLIVKPIVPQEAALSARLALWQSKLLRLLASKVTCRGAAPPSC